MQEPSYRGQRESISLGCEVLSHNEKMAMKQREQGWEEVEEGKKGINADGRRHDLVW